MIDLIPDSSDESETERDGAFSTRREIHATVLGLAVGLATGLTGSYELGGLFVFAVLGAKLGGLKSDALAEIQSEPWYAAAGFVVTTVASLLLA